MIIRMRAKKAGLDGGNKALVTAGGITDDRQKAHGIS
jgi:hypothetical protein